MDSKETFIRMSDGVELLASVREVGSPIWLIVTHGIGEHHERHSYFSDILNRDVNILRYDLRGHGRSHGKKAYVNDFNRFILDLSEVVKYAQDKFQMKKHIIFGHSMGALITSGYLQSYSQFFDSDEFYPERVFISAPPVGVGGAMGLVVNMLPKKVFNNLALLPSIPLAGLVNLYYLSHNETIKDVYKSDPLCCRFLHTKLLFEVIKSIKDIFSKPINVKCPAVCVYGSKDKIADTYLIKDYFKTIEKSFELKEFEGAFHEIHNEISEYRTPYFEFMKNFFLESRYDKK